MICTSEKQVSSHLFKKRNSERNSQSYINVLKNSLTFVSHPNLLYSKYRKLVETFHVVSECKTVVYFGWWLVLQF
jgi:hypothetical protein